jgi:hypothetical protein
MRPRSWPAEIALHSLALCAFGSYQVEGQRRLLVARQRLAFAQALHRAGRPRAEAAMCVVCPAPQTIPLRPPAAGCGPSATVDICLRLEPGLCGRALVL